MRQGSVLSAKAERTERRTAQQQHAAEMTLKSIIAQLAQKRRVFAMCTKKVVDNHIFLFVQVLME